MELDQGAELSLGQELVLLEEKEGPHLSVAIRKVKREIEEHELGKVNQTGIEELKKELEGMEWIRKRYRELCHILWDSEGMSNDYYRALEERGELGGEGGVLSVRGIVPQVQ